MKRHVADTVKWNLAGTKKNMSFLQFYKLKSKYFKVYQPWAGGTNWHHTRVGLNAIPPPAAPAAPPAPPAPQAPNTVYWYQVQGSRKSALTAPLVPDKSYLTRQILIDWGAEGLRPHRKKGLEFLFKLLAWLFIHMVQCGLPSVWMLVFHFHIDRKYRFYQK